MNHEIDDIISEIQALDSQTRDIVMLYLDLLLQAQETGRTVPEVPD